MGKRNDNGAGTISEYKYGYRYRVSVGLKADGTPERKTFYGKTKKECREKYKKWQEQGGKSKTKAITVEEWANEWLKLYKKGTISYGTYHNYEMYIKNRIIPNMGKFRVNAVKPVNIIEFYTTISGLSRTAQKDIHTILNGMFEAAVENEYCTENPVRNPPRIASKTKKPIQVFNSREIGYILQSDLEYHILPKLLLFTGLRVGEAVALQWGNVDLENGMLSITNATTRKEGGGWVDGDTKGRRDRTVYLTEEGIAFFKSLPVMGIYVLTAEDGRKLSPRMFETRYRHFFESYNESIDQLKGMSEESKAELKIRYLSPHKCRHTYATYLIKGGAELMAVQALLGHTSVKVTEIYTHVNEDNKFIRDNVTKLNFNDE